jgi:hypothetical protein
MALRKNMRISVHAVFMIGLLLVLCFCSACTSQSPSQGQAGTLPSASTIPTPVPGLSAASPGTSVTTASFDEAKTSLEGYNPQLSDDTRVYRVQGKGLDASGSAVTWVFTVNLDNTNQLLTYNGNNWRNTTISSVNFPEVIDFNLIISPAELFSRNRQTLFPTELSGAEVTRDLDLANSVYTVTITSGSDMKVYRFNATTGVLIS